jgi:hypothetical protein
VIPGQTQTPLISSVFCAVLTCESHNPCADHQPGSQQSFVHPRVLAAKLLMAAGSEAIIVSLTEAGDVLTYLPDCPAGPLPPDACHEPVPRPRHAVSTGVEWQTKGRGNCPPTESPRHCWLSNDNRSSACFADDTLQTASSIDQLLTGRLVAAAFAQDGLHMLLVAEAQWLLLHAPLWEASQQSCSPCSSAVHYNAVC